MKSSIIQTVLQIMRPGCFYRSTDLASEARLTTAQVGSALRELKRGGLVEQEAHRVYITKQRALF